jgi:hypothetical protein
MSTETAQEYSHDNTSTVNFLSQLHQWLKLGAQLDHDNNHLKTQISELQQRKDQLIAHGRTYNEMIETQNHLIMSLSDTSECNGGGGSSLPSLPANPSLQVRVDETMPRSESILLVEDLEVLPTTEVEI